MLHVRRRVVHSHHVRVRLNREERTCAHILASHATAAGAALDTTSVAFTVLHS